MACACGKGRVSQNAARGLTFVYDFTAPNTTEVITYGTPLEAKRAVRQHGGGVVRRRRVNGQGSA